MLTHLRTPPLPRPLKTFNLRGLRNIQAYSRSPTPPPLNATT
ncbi:hypothetical protein M3J09_013182 [Ascochyta lentis]